MFGDQCNCFCFHVKLINLSFVLLLRTDPEYLEFLERISKPVENLPSADIQLERKEAERAGDGKLTGRLIFAF